MTSKRMLEQLYIASQIGITSKENEKVLKDYYKVVLQDLDRLEIFEDIIRKYCYIKKYNDHKEITMSLSDYDEEEKCYINFLEKILKTYEDNKYHDK